MWYPDLVFIQSYPKTQEAFDKLQARCREQVIRLNREGRAKRTGTPIGWARQQKLLEASRKDAQHEAGLYLQIMENTGIISPAMEAQGRQVLQDMVAIVLERVRDPAEPEKVKPVHGTEARIKAAKVALEFILQKPSAKSEVTLSKAEDFLAQLVK